MQRSEFKRKPPRKRDQIPDDVRAAVWRRSNGNCEIHANDACVGWADQCHHRRRRSQAGEHTLENLLATCWRCHAYAHEHVAEAVARGWLLRTSVDNGGGP